MQLFFAVLHHSLHLQWLLRLDSGEGLSEATIDRVLLCVPNSVLCDSGCNLGVQDFQFRRCSTQDHNILAAYFAGLELKHWLLRCGRGFAWGTCFLQRFRGEIYFGILTFACLWFFECWPSSGGFDICHTLQLTCFRWSAG